MASNLPGRLADLRSLLQSLEWDELSMQIDREAHAKLAIVGPVNSGKSTLFNLIEGRKASAVTAVPGTTKGIITETVGPFVLIDTPGFGEVGGTNRAALAQAAAQSADLALLVLDASAGLRQPDFELFQTLRALKIPFLVVLNKIDLVKRDLSRIVADVQDKLGVVPIPISAKTGAGVGERLLPAIVAAHPWMVVALARELPMYRRQLSYGLIRSAAFLNGIVAAQPIPGLDIPILLAAQVRMVLRIAAIYGEPMSVRHAKELLTTIAGGVALRFLASQLAKVVPGPGWVVSAVVAGTGTWAIGRVAVAYFESGKRLTPAQLRERYRRLLRRRPAEPDSSAATPGEQPAAGESAQEADA